MGHWEFKVVKFRFRNAEGNVWLRTGFCVFDSENSIIVKDSAKNKTFEIQKKDVVGEIEEVLL